MIIQFNLHYHTDWGEELLLLGDQDILGNWKEDQALSMKHLGNGWWTAEIHLSNHQKSIFYQYAVRNKDGEISNEWGKPREVRVDNQGVHEILCQDQWFMPAPEEMALFSSAFTQVIFRHPTDNTFESFNYPKSSNKGTTILFKVVAPVVPLNCVVAIMGNTEETGNWGRPFAFMQSKHFPVWEYEGVFDDYSSLEYKYVLYNQVDNEVVAWELGDNRRFSITSENTENESLCISDGIFRMPNHWRGAGVAVPVFSLRTDQGTGIGEFNDLIPLVNWAKSVGLRMIQILPVNDTTATYTWVDSYPYAAISVFALHPVYASLGQMCHYHYLELEDYYVEARQSLNELSEIDYDEVMKVKTKFFRELYSAVSYTLDNDPQFQGFCQDNEEWLKDYAVFSYLRDQYKTSNFNEWSEYSIYNTEDIEELTDPESSHYEKIRLHYFIQYHLHIQMSFVSDYARNQGIVLKGDIPIGIYRYSVDAWVAPHLFNMDSQAGAPPDYFSTSGQNWGFPTYNWERMSLDGYSWWRKRLAKMADYFDAYRIDHVLGFFRIWEIPYEMIEGSLGHFNPALPFTEDELRHRGLPFEHDRYCLPYVRGHVLDQIIPVEARSWLEDTFLIEDAPGYYRFQPQFTGQREVKQRLAESQLPEGMKMELQNALFSLMSEVLFIKDPRVPYDAYNPRFALQNTRSYQELDDYSKHILNVLYNEYYYHRHEDFWREQGMIKLPEIVDATDMLVCAEDLGMVPKCVPPVLYELGILGLEIQRMPKQASDDFVYKHHVPYLSVFSPSSHDIAPLRAWWEQHREEAQKLYNHVLGKWGEAPYFCEPWIVREIIKNHLEAPSMWTVIPIQDIMGMDKELRRDNPFEEQINNPSTSTHYWRYRMHIDITSLTKAENLNDLLTKMIQDSNRDTSC